jgi:hypothetical protein
MDFIFMLTNRDRTVGNCLEVIDSISDLGLKHIGFKDIGVDQSVLVSLTKRIATQGATSYVEVVSTTPQSIRASITAAADLGVSRVLGGQDVAFALESFKPDGPTYYPFPGRPIGHPTQLAGNEEDIESDCRRAREAGCPGADLLAYRATEAEPRSLIRAARRGLGDDGYLIVAGSIDSTDRIAEAEDAGADAFTIGSAIFENRFAPGVTGVRGQCEAVLRAIA